MYDPSDPALKDMVTDLDADTLEPEAFRRLFRYWLDAKADRALPPVSAIDPLALPRDLLHLIGVMEHEPSGDRLRVRLAGTGIRQATGLEFTGHYTDAMPGAEEADRRFHWCQRTGSPYMTTGPLVWAQRDYKTYSVLALPFGTADGVVERIMLLFEFMQ